MDGTVERELQVLFGGSSTQPTTTIDGINLVVFRNEKSPNDPASSRRPNLDNGSNILDADIVFWDDAFHFYAGTSGCSEGFYIEDVAAHEFGHALGLAHSTVADATMYPSISTCSSGARTLDADDIAGVVSLYPPVPYKSAGRAHRIPHHHAIGPRNRRSGPSALCLQFTVPAVQHPLLYLRVAAEASPSVCRIRVPRRRPGHRAGAAT